MRTVVIAIKKIDLNYQFTPCKIKQNPQKVILIKPRDAVPVIAWCFRSCLEPSNGVLSECTILFHKETQMNTVIYPSRV